MNNEPEAPQWMKDMFYELSAMFEELFPDADRLNLEEMQQKLDEQQSHAESRALAPATIYFDETLRDPQ
jgi:inhibitor of KinA sporulation pathway (predicted exonuclease)